MRHLSSGATVAAWMSIEWCIGAAAAIGFELIGVLGVGLLSVVDSELFPDQTVWSGFGAGYGYVPLLLPLVGLGWVLRSRN